MGTVGEFPPITTLDLQLYIIAQEKDLQIGKN